MSDSNAAAVRQTLEDEYKLEVGITKEMHEDGLKLLQCSTPTTREQLIGLYQSQIDLIRRSIPSNSKPERPPTPFLGF